MKIGRLVLVSVLTILGCSSVMEHIKGGLHGLNSPEFRDTTHMVAVGNAVQAKTLLAQMPPTLKSQAQWHYLKARNLLAVGRADQAVAHLRIAMQRAGHVPAVLNDLAAALIMTGKPEQAIPLLKQINSSYFRKEFLNNLAAALLESGRLGEALNRFRMLTVSNPGDPVAWYNLSIANLRAKQYNKAISCMRRAVTLTPDDRDILTGLAMACANAGNTTCADLNYNKAISIYPTDWKLFDNYGAFLAEHGRDVQAQHNFQHALQLNPHCAACLYNMGRLNEKWGKNVRAIAYYQRFLDMKPDDPWAGLIRRHIEKMKKIH